MSSRRSLYSKRSVLCVCATLLGTGIAGCIDQLQSGDDDGVERPPPVDAISLNIVDVRSPDPGLTTVTIPLVFEIENTHSTDEIPSPTIDYTVAINETEVLTSRDEVVSLGPGDVTTETIELTLAITEFGSSLIDAIVDGAFTVEISGEIISDGERHEFSDRYAF